jgi:hypothetical protein
LRGIIFLASLVLAIASAATASADEKKAEPEYRLLVLDGTAVRWRGNADGRPTVLTFAFLTEPRSFVGARNCSRMLPPSAALAPSKIDIDSFRREVRAAFAMWRDAINIDFRETDDIAEAGILIGAEAEPRGRAFTNVATHGTAGGGMGRIAQSLICLNPQTRWKIGFDGDLDVYDLRYTIAHEIGHAIGLDHPGAEGQLMSYRYVEHHRGLRPGDIAGASLLYGARGAPRGVGVPVMPPRAPAREQETHDFGLGETRQPHAAPAR